ncbi:hypothetical protein DSECCO2_613290 [anaerobic digester metagenome]
MPAQFRDEFDGVPDVLVLSAGHREPEPEVDRPELRSFTEVRHPDKLLAGDARDRPGDRLRLAPDDRPERREDRIVPAGLDLHELVSDVRRLGLPDVDDDHLPVAEGVVEEEPFRVAGVAGEVTGVGVDRVRSPVDDKVRPVLHHPEGAARVPDLLDGQDRRSVADRGGVVDDAPDEFGHMHPHTLGLPVGPAPPIQERALGREEHTGGVAGRLIVGDILPCVSIAQDRVLQPLLAHELLRAEFAGVRHSDHPVPVHLHLDIVAEASAERADRVLNDHRQALPGLPSVRERSSALHPSVRSPPRAT